MLTESELAEARQVAASTMTGRVVLETGGTDGGWDPETGPTPGTPPTTVYDGPCRIQAVRSFGGNERDAAGQAVTVRAYKIALVFHTDTHPAAYEPGYGALVRPAPGQRARVLEYPRDPRLTGMVLTVTGVVHGDLGVETVLYADLDHTNQPAGGA